MKKLLLFALVLGLVTNVTAIDFEDIGYSVKGGVNYSSDATTYKTASVKTAADASQETSSGLGWNVGINTELPVADKLTLNSGAFITQRSITTKAKGTNKTDLETAKTLQDGSLSGMYLEIPVGVSYEVAESFNVQVGGYFGYNLSQTSVDVNSTIKDVTKDTLRKGDYGIQLGASYQMEEWTASVGYQLGLADTSTSAETELKQNTIQAQVAYNF